MRKKNDDLRVLRTKGAIREALTELIEEKGFEAITVKDITTKANINRGTFYIHYQDKYDLMTKCQEEIMEEMSSIARKMIPNILSELEARSSGITSFTLAVSIFEYLNDNRGFMKAVLGPNGDLTFQTKLKQFMWNALVESNPNSPIKKENFLVPGEYLVSYMASAHIGVIQKWIVDDRKETPQEMARILSTITLNGPLFAAGLKN